jgi:hypothetical protein
VRALVEVDGQPREMEFLTNNLSWSAASVADLYRCRWQSEVFFKPIKQSLPLCDFLGNSANAVRWQVWTALLLYGLMRFLSVMSGSRSLLYAALHAVAGGAVEESGSLGFAAVLWDSRWTLPLPGHPARRLFSRLCLRLLWDSSKPPRRNSSCVNG